MDTLKRFNLRVYALIINQANEILVSDEMRFGKSFTKFPGGGLEWGEGLTDGLKRELQEEMDLEAEVGALYYVNDFFQPSAFRSEDQLLSFYFRIKSIDFSAIPATKHEFPLQEEGEKFRWIAIADLTEDTFTFPVDKIVGQKLRKSAF